VDRRTAVLVDDDVRVALRDEDVSGAREELERDVVRHRCRGQEDGVLVSEELRGPSLELEDRRVLALLLVSDDSLRYRAAHRGSGLSDGVGAKVDHVLGLGMGWNDRSWREPSGPLGQRMVRGVPTGMSLPRRTMSALRIRMHPCETRPGKSHGSFVPWIPTNPPPGQSVRTRDRALVPKASGP
jgi:hypothetical protein